MYTVRLLNLFFFLYMILFSDIIKEVIDQQSTLYDNVYIVANFFKYEQVRLKWNLSLMCTHLFGAIELALQSCNRH